MLGITSITSGKGEHLLFDELLMQQMKLNTRLLAVMKAVLPLIMSNLLFMDLLELFGGKGVNFPIFLGVGDILVIFLSGRVGGGGWVGV